MGNRGKLLSVIVPVYNAERYLERCVNSILSQTYKNLELILVNDGSTDSSPSICEGYAQRDGRVKALSQENQGPNIARKTGIDASTGDYIAFVDADDYTESAMYEDMIGALEESGADIAECGANLVDMGGAVIRVKKVRPGKIEADPLEYFLYGTEIMGLVCKVFKRKLFHDLDMPRLYMGEDQYLNAQLFYNAGAVVKIDNNYYYYVQSQDSLVRGDVTLRRLDAIKSCRLIYEFCREKRPELSAFAAYKVCWIICDSCYLLAKSGIEGKKRIRAKLYEYYKTLYPEILKNKYYKKSVNCKIRLSLLIFYISPVLYIN